MRKKNILFHTNEQGHDYSLINAYFLTVYVVTKNAFTIVHYL